MLIGKNANRYRLSIKGLPPSGSSNPAIRESKQGVRNNQDHRHLCRLCTLDTSSDMQALTQVLHSHIL